MSVPTANHLTDRPLSLARQVLYRFAGLSLLDPKYGAWEQLAALRNDPLLLGAGGLICDLPEAIPEESSSCDQPITDLDPRLVLDRLPPTRDALNEQYEATFGLLVSNACPPYETEYIDSKFSFQRSNTLADVSGFYHAFGMRPTSHNRDRSDHIVQELEFMAVLIGLTRQADEAAREQREQRRATCESAQLRFLREHLGWWALVFAKLLSREAGSEFYRSAACFLAALCTADRVLLGLPLPGTPTMPSEIERPDACTGCELS